MNRKSSTADLCSCSSARKDYPVNNLSLIIPHVKRVEQFPTVHYAEACRLLKEDLFKLGWRATGPDLHSRDILLVFLDLHEHTVLLLLLRFKV
jgi:hypothetical protein